MGLQSDIQIGISSAFDSDLSDAVKVFTLKSSAINYNPTSGGTSGPPITSGSWRGVFTGFERSGIQFNSSKPADTVVISLISEAPFNPTIGNVIFYDNQEFEILSIEKDPTITVYFMTCRNASLWA